MNSPPTLFFRYLCRSQTQPMQDRAIYEVEISGSNKGGISALFANFNRGKKSLRLDIKEEKG